METTHYKAEALHGNDWLELKICPTEEAARIFAAWWNEITCGLAETRVVPTQEKDTSVYHTIPRGGSVDLGPSVYALTCKEDLL